MKLDVRIPWDRGSYVAAVRLTRTRVPTSGSSVAAVRLTRIRVPTSGSYVAAVRVTRTYVPPLLIHTRKSRIVEANDWLCEVKGTGGGRENRTAAPFLK